MDGVKRSGEVETLLMPYFLKHHPFGVQAYFKWSLGLVYAWPKELLQPLLPPGLELDLYEDLGFVAVAMVEATQMRPHGWPAWTGRSFFLTGYRLFVRYRTREGRRLRGLKILRSDADRRLMVWLGNRLTHYGYRLARVRREATDERICVEVAAPDGADLKLRAETNRATALPPGSPFRDFATARRFAGPMPFTFDYDAREHAVVRVEGVRSHWKPVPVAVEVERIGFFEQPPFRDAGAPKLANAFLVRDVPYQWKRGILEALKS